MNTRFVRTLVFCLTLSLPAACFAQLGTTPYKQVEVFGQKIQYVEAGSGPNVILLHGLGGDAQNWALTIPAVAAHYHVYAPDQIGFGRSDKPEINYRVGTMVDFLNSFMKKLSIDKATLVGNSLGGWISVSMTLAHPERVEKMVLVDSAGFNADVTREQLLALNPSTLEGQRAVMKLILYNAASFSSDATIESQFTNKLKRGDAYTVDRFIDSIVRHEDTIDGQLSRIKVPTLIVWGHNDALTPYTYAERFAKEVVGSQLVTIEKCGHVPQLEKAQEFNTALLKFLGQ
jgi:pimeloyl-ACP methyl ester carboxylesterase